MSPTRCRNASAPRHSACVSLTSPGVGVQVLHQRLQQFALARVRQAGKAGDGGARDVVEVDVSHAVTGLESTPMPSISISMVSPGFIHTGGVRA